ncbi:unnamed protein product [Lactuca virosa]|uniref:Peptidase S10, serine carboxypeptidase, Alpha/Beta hydrolase fold protein n=1 Tax=Lactuca virosa TaxID=75947 RepID=A0AAU9NC25_9ASTR|nr:unnamed protein product [Lactuca virosa]
MESKHILVSILITFALFISASNSRPIIRRLPGFDGDLPFTLEAGYIGVGEDDAVQIFYYFVESERNPSEDPLLIYLTGGPGTSVLYSMMYQIGPLNFDLDASWENNITLKLNPYAWNKVANVIYIDAPAGAGFAYATTYEASRSSDSLLASNAYDFLRKWLMEHPRFLSNPLYISGISYMGIILPNVALHVYNGNEHGNQPHMNIKGVISVSPLTDKFGDFNSRFEFAHRLSLISDEMYESTEKTCNGNYVSLYNDLDSIRCSNNLQWVDECTSMINLENILEPLCATTDPACREATFGLVVAWANDKDVQKALNVREGTIETWEWQNSTIHYNLGKNDTVIYSYDVFSTIPIHKQLLAKKCQYLIICGDHDMVFPHVGTEKWIRSLNLPIEKRWEPWFVNDQIAGYQMTYAQSEYLLTYATIKGAGHGIALYKPEEALAMVDEWLDSRIYLSDV